MHHRCADLFLGRVRGPVVQFGVAKPVKKVANAPGGQQRG